MERSKQQILLFLIMLAILFLSACRGVDPVIKVGLVAPFEGRYRDIGYDVLYSARLAVRQLNAAGGIDGTRVALVALDDSGNPEFAAATADSLIIDPNVVAVVGHWLPETTAVATQHYDESSMAFIAGGKDPYLPADPAQLPADFVDAYKAVTPFDEIPGHYAGPAYDAYQSLWNLLVQAKERHGAITRETVNKTLSELE